MSGPILQAFSFLRKFWPLTPTKDYNSPQNDNLFVDCIPEFA